MSWLCFTLCLASPRWPPKHGQQNVTGIIAFTGPTAEGERLSYIPTKSTTQESLE